MLVLRNGRVRILREGVDLDSYLQKRRDAGDDVDVIDGDQPTIDQLEAWSMDGVAEALDGCSVEPDGTCEHGSPSWLLALGYI